MTPDETGILRVATHNVWVGQRGTTLSRNLHTLAADTHHPHAIAVQEATGLRTPIDGYQRVAVEFPDHPDNLGCQLLVREDVEVHARRLVPVGGPWWTGPKHGLAHPPKVFVGATLGHLGQRWDVLSVHRVWTGPKDRNTDTWKAEHVVLAAWLDARSRRASGTRPVIAVGDWNARPDDLHDLPGHKTFHGIDGALTLNVAHTTSRELPGRYGSDAHQPIVFTHHTPQGTK